ncbi:Fc.00g057460.m01.CDS01 [Cosmosporella sp. VM-42]
MHIENMVGDTLRGDHEYRIQSLQIRDDYLDVYLVTRADRPNNSNIKTSSEPYYYEAQAFACDLPRENEGLCQARRRRMKRIFRSKNFEQEIAHGGRRFLISRVQRNGKEWRDLREQIGGGKGALEACWLSEGEGEGDGENYNVSLCEGNSDSPGAERRGSYAAVTKKGAHRELGL